METPTENQDIALAPNTHPDIHRLETVAALMDNRFKIPGTDFRFGFDAIVGLIPYAGDILGLLVAVFLMFVMVRHGAGPIVMVRMMGNYLLDASVGTIPFLGDIFDFGFKANCRNVEMLKQYYAETPQRPSAWKSVLLLAFLFLGVLVCVVWASIHVSALFLSWLMNA